MKKAISILFVFCCLNSLLSHLKAETITYDFSSPEKWTIGSGSTTHPGTGTSAQIKEIYYTGNNDCFVGNGEVYFDNGYLMLKYGASLKIPYNLDRTVNKVILHSHSGGSTSVKVNVYDSHDGFSVSTVLTWGKDADHEYVIPESKRQSPLYIKVSNKSYNARITSITVDYTSAGGGDSDGGNEDNPEGDDENDKEEEIVVSAPIFNPTSTSFSTESLIVAMDAAEGCEIYYTKDGSIPSYTNAEEYNGTKGNSVTIYASESKVTLQAIAVNPATGKCSYVSSATYTYVEVSNNGTKGKPYTVAEVKTKFGEIGKVKWVKGIICGAVDDDGNLITSNITISTNIAIGDESEYVAVKFTDQNVSNIRKNLNLKDHPYFLGKEILIEGELSYSYPSIMVEITGNCENSGDYQITYNLPINSYGYASLYLDMPVLVSTGSIAYYCVTDGSRANLYPVGDVIPASVGVIVSSIPNKTCTLTYTTQTCSNTESILANNQLIGFIWDTIIGKDGYVYYALNVKDNKIGFYIPQTSSDTGFTAKANKAYLRVPVEYQAGLFVLHNSEDETTIVPLNQVADDVIYDLQGRIVSSPSSGIYIMGGKKVLVK